MIRSGRAAGVFPIRPPCVPGNGIGGEVVGVGPGVEPSLIGRPVVAHTGGAGGCGGYAARAVVAFVLGAARGKAKLDVVGEAGADVGVDYGRLDWTALVRSETGGAGPTDRRGHRVRGRRRGAPADRPDVPPR